MLLSARLYRSTARSFKAFPSNRLNENANALISSESKGWNVKEPIDSRPEKTCPDQTVSESPVSSSLVSPQLEVNKSNLKFRKTKSKKKSESEPDKVVIQDSDNDKLETAGEELPMISKVIECLPEKPETQECDQLTELLLGDFRSDFKQWLDATHSLQVSDSSRKGQGCLEKREDKINSCCLQHHDSMLSSCNASECSEEDKDETKTDHLMADLVSLHLCSNWDGVKSCENPEKATNEGDCKAGCCLIRDNYSSGCHSLTSSSSGVVSDSESSSPGFKSSETLQQEVFVLCGGMNSNETPSSPASNFTSQDDSANISSNSLKVEDQFQVVQKKKLKPKAVISSNETNDYRGVDMSLESEIGRNICNMRKINNLKTQNLEGRQGVESHPHSNKTKVDEKSVVDVIPSSCSSPLNALQSTKTLTRSVCDESHHSLMNSRPGSGVATSTDDNSDSVRDAWSEDRWNVVRGGKKVKNNKTKDKVESESDNVKQVDRVPVSPTQSSKSCQENGPVRKKSFNETKSSQAVFGRETQNLANDRNKATSSQQVSCDATCKMTSDEKKRAKSNAISFGSGCKDLDTFNSPFPSASKSKSFKSNSTKNKKLSRVAKNVVPQTHFDLRQAQKFLMQAYNAVQKQKSEDSSSVLLYS